MANQDPTCDTKPAAAVARLELLRRMGGGGRLRAGLRFSSAMIRLSRAALRKRIPGLDERSLLLLRIEQSFDAELARKVKRHMEAVGWTGADSTFQRWRSSPTFQLGGEPESRPAESSRSGGSSAWGRVPLATREALEESFEPCHPFAKVGLTNLQTFDTPFKARAHA